MLCICGCFQQEMLWKGRKEHGCCAWADMRRIRLRWGDQQRVPLTHACHVYKEVWRWILVNPFVIFTQETNQKTVIASRAGAKWGWCSGLSPHAYCMSHLVRISCMSLNASPSPSANVQSYTQFLSRSYTPKSLRLLQLGATIKTVVARVTILKRLPSDQSRHIQSRGQILFIKRAKTSAQLLLLKAPTMRVLCVLCNTRQGHTVIITRGCAFFCGKLFLN